VLIRHPYSRVAEALANGHGLSRSGLVEHLPWIGDHFLMGRVWAAVRAELEQLVTDAGPTTVAGQMKAKGMTIPAIADFLAAEAEMDAHHFDHACPSGHQHRSDTEAAACIRGAAC
jgi:hypothetical protein